MSENSSGADAEPSGSDSSMSLPKSRSFELLSTPRRREAIDLLCEHGHVTLPDIAEAVTVGQLEKEITEIDPEKVTDTYMMLYHSDIPKLAEADVVLYDQEQDLVATGENFDAVAAILERTTGR